MTVLPTTGVLFNCVGETSGNIIQFTIPSRPIPSSFATGFTTAINNILWTLNGVPQGFLNMGFFNIANEGGFVLGTVGTPEISVSGTQLYTGTEQNPVFSPFSQISMPYFPPALFPEAFNVSGSAISPIDFSVFNYETLLADIIERWPIAQRTPGFNDSGVLIYSPPIYLRRTTVPQ